MSTQLDQANRRLIELKAQRAKKELEKPTTAPAIKQKVDDLNKLSLEIKATMAIIEEEEKKLTAASKQISYEVAEDEKGLYHVLLRKGSKHDSDTGKPLGVAYIQKFGVKDFINFKANHILLGFTEMTILHDPTI